MAVLGVRLTQRKLSRRTRQPDVYVNLVVTFELSGAEWAKTRGGFRVKWLGMETEKRTDWMRTRGKERSPPLRAGAQNSWLHWWASNLGPGR